MKDLVMSVKTGVDNVKDKAGAFLVTGSVMAANMVNEVFASSGSTDIVSKGGSMAQTIYGDIVKISTPIAAAAVVLALVMSMFGHDQKKIDTLRKLAISVGVTWFVINGLGFFLAYGTKLLGQGGTITNWN